MADENTSKTYHIEAQLRGDGCLETRAEVRASTYGDLLDQKRKMEAEGRADEFEEVNGEKLRRCEKIVEMMRRQQQDTYNELQLKGATLAMLEDMATKLFPPELDRLSRREREVFELIVIGTGQHDIAEILSVTPRTVKDHKQNIKYKLSIDGDASERNILAWWAKKSSLGTVSDSDAT